VVADLTDDRQADPRPPIAEVHRLLGFGLTCSPALMIKAEAASIGSCSRRGKPYWCCADEPAIDAGLP
jgi:hypothetical protein